MQNCRGSTCRGWPPRRPALALALPLLLAGCCCRGAAAKGAGGEPGNITAGNDINATGACAAALQSLCVATREGDGRLAHCLRDANKAARARKDVQPTTPECDVEIKTFFRKVARAGIKPDSNKLVAVEPVPGFRAACMGDVQRFCFNKPPRKVMKCLKQMKKQVAAACREKVHEVQQLQAEDMSLDPAFFDACKADLGSLPECNSNSTGAKKACLQRHREKLSETCREQLFQREQEDAEDIRFNVDVFTTCKPEISGVCKDTEFGEARMLKCLWEKSLSQSVEGFSEACKEKVRNLTARSVADYRLDFRLRTRCAGDIQAFCAAQRELVDNLTISELFGGEGGQGYFAKGASGRVVHCLKGNYTALQSRSCQQEVRRVVSVHALNAGADPVLLRRCEGDLAFFCAQERPEDVHLCLRRNMEQLEKNCKETEALQGSLEARDISMKPQVLVACKTAIVQFCHELPPGEAAVIRCLQDHYGEGGFPAKCKQVVEADLQASSHDWRFKYGVWQHCKKDISSLCKKEMSAGGGAVLACIKRRAEKITDQGCRSEVRRIVKQGADNALMDTEVAGKCQEDIKRFCSDVAPGGGRVHGCLLKRRRELSRPCASAEFENQRIQAGDIRMSPKAMKHCGDTMKKLCPDTPTGDGRMWACLEDRRSHEDMPAACAAVVEDHLRLKHSEFFLNPGLSKHCEQDALALCPAEVAAAGSRDFSSGGAVITCLVEHRGKVNNTDCMASLRRKEAQRVEQVGIDPSAKDACVEDVQRFCKDVKGKGKGLVQQCLQKNREQLSEMCGEKQKLYMALASEDIRVNPVLRSSCRAAFNRFCEHVKPGGGRGIGCLLDHMHDPEIGSECRDKLVQEQAKRTETLDFNPTAKANCAPDLEVLMKAGKCGKKSTAWRLNCLTKHSVELTDPDCKQAVKQLLRRHSADVRAKPGMGVACKTDMERLCGGVQAGAGRMHECLRKNLDALDSDGCKAMVQEVLAVDKKSASVNYQIITQCVNERQAFCVDVQPGRSRLLACLGLHREDAGFGQDCRVALRTADVAQAVKKAPASVSMPELKLWLEGHRGFVERWGGVLLTGSVGFFATVAFGVSYYVIRQRFFKSGYTVVVARDLEG